jgi:predicted RNA binding protein YcfA (HicA-like mRNA interferase family)
MSRIPRVTSPDLIAALEKGGFRVLRVNGSHYFLRHEDGAARVCPRTPAKPSAPASFTKPSEIAD